MCELVRLDPSFDLFEVTQCCDDRDELLALFGSSGPDMCQAEARGWSWFSLVLFRFCFCIFCFPFGSFLVPVCSHIRCNLVPSQFHSDSIRVPTQVLFQVTNQVPIQVSIKVPSQVLIQTPIQLPIGSFSKGSLQQL